MTIDEALNVLKQYIDYNNPDVPDFYTMKEACEVVIEALEQEPCADAISRRAAIDVLNINRNPVFHDSVDYEGAMYDICKLPLVTPQYTEAEIQKMQDLEFAEIQKAYEIGKAENPNKWIPVSERLPEEKQMVLVTSNDMYLKNINPCIGWRNGIYWIAYTANGTHFIQYPIAWMPLPERYKASPTGEEVEE